MNSVWSLVNRKRDTKKNATAPRCSSHGPTRAPLDRGPFHPNAPRAVDDDTHVDKRLQQNGRRPSAPRSCQRCVEVTQVASGPVALNIAEAQRTAQEGEQYRQEERPADSNAGRKHDRWLNNGGDKR
ncbi:unnamed protein product [Soboliphyme baturini]|uniref:DUF2188 domain-containing protein n=1 Tax=Soboliphyme baturini TaxID=241478 RepID=A0A183IPM0_9BILA|nr:unnamed protein product [Soboliphyme baturini]